MVNLILSSNKVIMLENVPVILHNGNRKQRVIILILEFNDMNVFIYLHVSPL